MRSTPLLLVAFLIGSPVLGRLMQAAPREYSSSPLAADSRGCGNIQQAGPWDVPDAVCRASLSSAITPSVPSIRWPD